MDLCNETRRKQEQEAKQKAEADKKKDLRNSLKYGSIPFLLLVSVFPHLYDWIDVTFREANGFVLFITSIFIFYVLCLILFELVLWIFGFIFRGVKWGINGVKKTYDKTPSKEKLSQSVRDSVRYFLSLDAKTLIVIGVIVAIFIIFLFWLFPMPRYTNQVAASGLVYQHDRWTGKSYIIYSNGVRREVKDN